MKKCPKCNAELADDAMFCNVCGEKLEAPAKEEAKEEAKKEATAETPAATNDTLEEADTKAKNDKTGKIVVIAGIAAAAVIALIVIFVIVGANAYKKPVNKYIQLLNSKSTNYEAFNELFQPDFEIKYDDAIESVKNANSKDYKEEMKEYRAEAFESLYETLEDEYGEKAKIKVVRFDKEKMKKKDLNTYRDSYKSIADWGKDKLDDSDYYDDMSANFEDEYDEAFSESEIKKLAKSGEEYMKAAKKVKVSEGYTIDLKLEIKGKDDEGTAKVTFTVIKVNGKWIIADTKVKEGTFVN